MPRFACCELQIRSDVRSFFLECSRRGRDAMKGLWLVIALGVSSVFAISLTTSFGGEDSASATKKAEARIKASLGKLSEPDRKLAESQRYCAVMPDHRLGSMGAPVKIQIAGKPVFLCCKGCRENALANPNETLAAAEKLKKLTTALAKLPAADREAAEAQRFCAVMSEHRLGSMGAPVKVVISGKPVFLCCEGCREKALADPEGTLAKADKLRAAREGNTE
jgi:fructose-specific component phosphotransferase system IIB-like protein